MTDLPPGVRTTHEYYIRIDGVNNRDGPSWVSKFSNGSGWNISELYAHGFTMKSEAMKIRRQIGKRKGLESATLSVVEVEYNSTARIVYPIQVLDELAHVL
jgi:hypothetical protein